MGKTKSTDMPTALQDPLVKKGIRYRIALIKMLRAVTQDKPGSDAEMDQRIHEYLQRYPESATILADVNVTNQHLLHQYTTHGG
jgi:hypothetical protein